MNEQPYQKQKSRGCLGFFIIGLIVLFVGGAGLWYFAAGKLGEAVTAWRERLPERGQSAECANQAVRGFPFRLGIFCDSFNFSDKNSQVNLELGAVRSAAQVYAPGKLVAEMDGPAIITSAANDQVSINWDSMRSSVNANLDGLNAISIAGRDVKMVPIKGTIPAISAQQIEIHARKLGENDLDAAIGATEIEVPNLNGRTLAPISFTIEFSGTELFDVARRGRGLKQHIMTNGASGILKALKLEPQSGGELEVSGPIEVNTRGQVSARLQISVTDVEKLLKFARVSAPEWQKELDQLATTLAALGGGKLNQQQKFSLNIRENALSLGLIPLGSFPPLF